MYIARAEMYTGRKQCRTQARVPPRWHRQTDTRPTMLYAFHSVTASKIILCSKKNIFCSRF